MLPLARYMGIETASPSERIPKRPRLPLARYMGIETLFLLFHL